MDFFPYGEKEVSYLKRKDAKLGRAIDRIGAIRRPVNSDIFSAHTKPPERAKTILTPTVRKNVVLPDIFEPEIIKILLLKQNSLFTLLSFGNKGCPSF